MGRASAPSAHPSIGMPSSMARASADIRDADGCTNEKILQGIRRDVLAADQGMNKGLEQLDRQTEQIRSINNDVDQIGINTDQAARIIKCTRPFGMLQEAMSRKRRGQAGRAECKWMWRDTKVPALLGEAASSHNVLRWSRWQGFEDTIKDIDGREENRRIFCKIVLPGRGEDKIEFENVRDAVQKIQNLLVLQHQAALAAVEGSVSGLDSLLSSSSSAAAASYAPPQAAPRRSAAARQLPGQKEEDLLADIGGSLDGMYEKTQQMNRTLDVQNQMVSAVAEKMERERQRIEDETRKLQKMREKKVREKHSVEDETRKFSFLRALM